MRSQIESENAVIGNETTAIQGENMDDRTSGLRSAEWSSGNLELCQNGSSQRQGYSPSIRPHSAIMASVDPD